MSTRGCVAIKTGNMEWRGCYNGSDSHPKGLGKDLWDFLHSEAGEDLQAVADGLLECTGWYEFLNGGLCEYCGKVRVGYPNIISGKILSPSQYGEEIWANIIRTGFRDPDAKYHDHETKKANVFSKNVQKDASLIQWAYVVDPIAKQVEIFTVVRAKGHHIQEDRGGKLRAPNYQYCLVAVVDLNGDEPDWEKIQERGLGISEIYHEFYEGKEEPQNH